MLLLSTVLLILISCSGDDQDPSNSDAVIEKPDPVNPDPTKPIASILLQKKIVVLSGASVFRSDIVYDGNKIIGSNVIHFSTEYNYVNDKLVNSVQKGTAAGNNENITTYSNKYDTSNFLTEQVITFYKDNSVFTETIQYVY